MNTLNLYADIFLLEICTSDIHLFASDGETPVLELWGVRSIPSLSLFPPGPLWLAVVVFIRVSSMGLMDLLKKNYCIWLDCVKKKFS